MAEDSTTGGLPTEEQHGVAVAKLTAEDLSNPLLLEDTFEALVASLKGCKLVVDLSDIDGITSLGVAVLIAAQGLALINKTELAFAAVSPGVMKLLKIVGADKTLTISRTVDDAIKSLRGGSGRSGAASPSWLP